MKTLTFNRLMAILATIVLVLAVVLPLCRLGWPVRVFLAAGSIGVLVACWVARHENQDCDDDCYEALLINGALYGVVSGIVVAGVLLLVPTVVQAATK
jgi:hypothetical protein